MMEAYLNFPGNAAEAAAFYASAFQAGAPDLMTYSQMPPGVDDGVPEEMRGMVMHGNVATFAGNLMLSDDTPGEDMKPTRAVGILVSHADHDRLRSAFNALSQGGEVVMALSPTFFSLLYGQLKDKYGFSWQFIDPTPMEGQPG